MFEGKDVFIEHMIKRKPTYKSRFIRLIVWPAAGLLTFTLLVLVPESFQFIPFVMAAGCYGAWQLFIRQSVEFEYILTNGELDVDRIVARRNRKRFLSVDCRRFEILAQCSSSVAGEMKSQRIVKRVDSSSSPKSENRWFAIFKGKDEKCTLLIFEPDQRMLDALKHVVPPQRFRRM